MNEPSPLAKSPTFRQRCAAELRSRRERAGLSQEVLAELAGFHRSYVSQIERAVQNMSIDNFEKLAATIEQARPYTGGPLMRLRVAGNIKMRRQAQGLSQEKLAEMAGLHRTYVSQVERGVTAISLDNIDKLATALSSEAEALLADQSEK